MKTTITLLFAAATTLSAFAQDESSEQLRDPEYLIKKYNQLAVKYNVLVKKVRLNLDAKQPVTSIVKEIRVTNPINSSLERQNADQNYKIRSLQAELSQATQRNQDLASMNRVLEDQKAQLKDKLKELHKSESELEERSRRLAVENRRSETETRNFETLEKQLKNEIRELKSSGSTANRQLVIVEEGSRKIVIENKQLKSENDRLKDNLDETENALASFRDSEDGLRRQILSLRDAVAEKGRENSILAEEKEVSEVEIRTLRADISDLAGVQFEKKRAIDDLHDEINHLYNKHAKLTKDFEARGEAIEDMDQAIQDIASREERLRNRLAVIDLENQELVIDLENLQEANDKNLQEANDRLKYKQLDFDARETEYLDQINDLDSRNAALSTQLARLRNQRTRLRNDIIDVIEDDDDRVDR